MKKFYFASIITILYIPFVTIVGELFEPLKNFFKTYFWHHWLGKGIVLILLYGTLLLIFGKTKETESDEKYMSVVLGLSFLSALAIFVFFVVEYGKHL